MANTKSAGKAARVIARRTEVNKARRSRMRGFVRKVEEALAAGDPKVAAAALKEAEPELMRAAQKGVGHRLTASRKISRLCQTGRQARKIASQPLPRIRPPGPGSPFRPRAPNCLAPACEH